jgi:hypothetical protein
MGLREGLFYFSVLGKENVTHKREKQITGALCDF